MSDINRKFSARIAASQWLADLQINESVTHCYAQFGGRDLLLSDLLQFVTDAWWLAGYQMYKGKVATTTEGWFFNSVGQLVCRADLRESFAGQFVFLWKKNLIGPCLYHIDSDDADPILVVSPTQTPELKNGAIFEE